MSGTDTPTHAATPADAAATLPAGRRRRRSLRGAGGADGARAGAATTADPLALALATVGDRWSLAVVSQLVEGPRRFNDLATGLAPIARTVLSDRLRRLEQAGVLSRRRYSDAPVRCNYRLTASGTELAGVCAVLADWGARHLGDACDADGDARA